MEASKYLHHADALPANEYLHLLVSATENALAVSEVVIINLQMLGANKATIIEYLHHFRNRFIDVVIWDKQRARPILYRNVLNSRYELLLFFTNRQSICRDAHNAYGSGAIRQALCWAGN